MFQVPLTTSASFITSDAFWRSISIYHNRPHLVNRKILVADQALFYKLECSQDDIQNIEEIFSVHALTYELRKLENVNKNTITKSFLLNLLHPFCKNFSLVQYEFCNLDELEQGIFLSVRIIKPRMKSLNECVELIVLDTKKDFVHFTHATSLSGKNIPLPGIEYSIELTREGFMRVLVKDFEDADTKCAEWLAGNLFDKLIKWTEEKKDANIVQSLSQVPLESYCNLYSELKEKHGEPLRKIWWEKTKTDPQKFIFEDIAIASYLICLWSREYSDPKALVNFVDCGCGNGLLVHILNQEGFRGYGIDLRRRKVWDLFVGTADLRVGVVQHDSLFCDATWLIGNHSDELTPWLPVIALKSSPKTNYFVLPCCPYDFNGKKYIRQNTAVSQYADYLNYIRNISELCKFDTSIDKLRIPSTKRTCFIGLRRNEDEETLENAKRSLEQFISSKFQTGSHEFTTRSPVEKVRNCTQIDKNIINHIVHAVMNILLSTRNVLSKKDGTDWNIGGSVHLGDLTKLVSKSDLDQLKNECGGVQTLLKNHRFLFIVEEGKVSVRKPYMLEETTKYKDKPCWFFKFHPDGCLYDSENCGYKHDIK